MAGSNEIKNKIILEGEAQYKTAMADISRELKEHKAALKAAAAEYDNAGDSMLAMYRQGDALERILETQAEALRLMHEQLEKTEAAYGKNSREATELRTRISNMRAEMARTEAQARQFRQRMDDAADGMQDSVQAADRAEKALGELGEGAEKTETQVGGLADALDGLDVSDLAALAGKLGGVAAIGKGISAGLALGNDTLESWNQLAAYTGLTGDALERVKEDARAVYRTGIGEDLADVSQATATIYQLTGQTGTGLQDCTTYALALRDTFDHDVSESARAAAVLMEAFGLSGRDAYDLITTGAQNGADKNGNLLDTINEYAPYFAAAGKDADEFFYALITGAQNGVYDVDKIGDAWKEFTIRLGDGSANEALGELGFAVDDVTRKIAAGGPAADLATQEIVTALAGVEDEYDRNRLGIALFGTQWEDTKGKVLPVFASMETGLTQVEGAAQKLADVKYSDLDTAWEGLTRRIQAMAEPTLLAGVNGLIGVIDNVSEAWDRFSEGDLAGGMEALSGGMSEELQAQTQTAQAAGESLRGELAALDEQINNAFAAGDNVTGWTLTAQREKLLAEIEQIEVDAVAAMGEAGTATADALGETSGDMELAAQEVGEEAVTALEDAQPDMMDAGEGMGTSAELGLSAGASGMYGAGEDAADGAVSGMYTGVSGAYSAGQAVGGAFLRGYRQTMQIRSPSRVMYDAAGDTTDGLFKRFEEDRERLYDAAADLEEAVALGYGESGTGNGAGGYDSAGGADPDAIAQAVARALSGMGLYCDGERMGEMMEVGVSRATRSRAMATVRGQSSIVKGW